MSGSYRSATRRTTFTLISGPITPIFITKFSISTIKDIKIYFGHYFTPIKDRVQVIPLKINWFIYLKPSTP